MQVIACKMKIDVAERMDCSVGNESQGRCGPYMVAAYRYGQTPALSDFSRRTVILKNLCRLIYVYLIEKKEKRKEMKRMIFRCIIHVGIC